MSDTVFYTDMISEAAEYAGFPYGVTAQTKNLYGGIIKSKVVIETAEQEKMLGKKRGIYYTFDNPSDKKDAKRDKILIEEMAAVFVRLAAKAVKGRPEILVVGLGNRDIRADALGIEVINRLIITRPYFEENSLLARGARTELSAIAPGVYGLTGIQSEGFQALFELSDNHGGNTAGKRHFVGQEIYRFSKSGRTRNLRGRSACIVCRLAAEGGNSQFY